MRRGHGGLNFGKQRKKFNLPLFKEIMSWIIESAIVIVIAYVFVNSFGSRTSVVGAAMETQLTNGEQILVNRFIYLVLHPKAGDVIVFLPNGNEKSHYYVRRVIGTPGDTVLIRNGAVYINGVLYEEPLDTNYIQDPGIAADELTLENGEYFVLGDNRGNSEDSRYANIGMIKEEYILGKAWFHFSSFQNMGMIR